MEPEQEAELEPDQITSTTPAEESDAASFLKQHPPYDRMEPEHLDYLVSKLREIRFADGEAITDPAAGPAEWFYVLRSGLVVGEESGEDERISGNAFELIPGECFPIGALVANRPIRNVQRAVGDVVCLAMPRAGFNVLREISPEFGAYCTHRLSGLLEKVNRKVRAEAARDLGEDSSLNVTLKEKRLRHPLTSGPDVPIATVLRRMSEARVGSMLIVDGDGRPLGIFTLRDLMNRVALQEVPYSSPIRAVMTPDPITIPNSAFAFEAAMKMAHAGIHHLVVVADDRLVGVVSERDLFSMQRVGLVNLSKSISHAASVDEVARNAADIRVLVAQMIAQGMKVGQITQIITLLNDQIAVRLIDLVLEQEGGAPLPFTWMAFGSEGRQEQTLKTDQDNGILFQPPAGMEADAGRAILMPIARRINDALSACGFPLCTGGIMAQNPECCLTPDQWKARFSAWIDQGTPEHLLKGSIFFDFRPLWGPEGPLDELRHWLLEKTARNTRFLKQMAANALRNTPPLGVFRGFRLSGSGEQSHTIDLKVNGVTPFIDAMRIIAVANRIPATNTVARLTAATERGLLNANDSAAWRDAYDYIRLLRMRVNELQAEEGKGLSNRVAPDTLNDLDRRILKMAFRESKLLQSKLSLDYQL
jgi:CBS domain-containing protein